LERITTASGILALQESIILVKIYDVSVLVHNGIPTWPGDPKFSMSLASSIANGGVVAMACEHN
jgi:hypothetical protein